MNVDPVHPEEEASQATEPGPRWYALRTRSRHEKHVREQLGRKGVEPLLPTVTRLSQWKDRKKQIEVPLFAGYCFARFSWGDRLRVLQIPGVVNVVGGGSRPEPIPDEQIEALRTLMQSTLPYDSYPYLREGMPVEVTKGPLKGVRGLLVRKVVPFRLVISVHLIRQSAAVQIDASDVAPL